MSLNKNILFLLLTVAITWPSLCTAAGEPSNAKELAEWKSDLSPSEKFDRDRKAKMPAEELAWETVLESNLGSYYLPLYKEDKAAGRETAWDYVKDDPSLPRVLIIGDSISRGYTMAARKHLKGIANVHRAPANCGPSQSGLNNLDIWLGDGKWDLIQFNFGIHDRNTSPETYKQNLEKLAARLQATGAQLIWARSTPLNGTPDTYPKGSMVRNNAIADEVMKQMNIPINDLYSVAQPLTATLQTGDGCHFRDEAYDILGKAVAEAIEDALPDEQATLYLSPIGDDANPGTRAKPFASLERARDAARAQRGATVILANGTYRLFQTFELDPRDSGTTFRGENARITGSIAIPNSAVKPVTDPAILTRLLPEVRKNVLEIDLHKLGVTEFGKFGPRGFRRPYIPAPLELFIDDEPLTVAQWPNPGEPGVPIGRVIDKGAITRTPPSGSMIIDVNPPPPEVDLPLRGATFTFDTDRPARWTQADDIWLTGIFSVGWADNTVQIKEIDMEKKTIQTVHSHMYGFGTGQPWNTWFAMNLLEEIDLPGEFMADQQTGKLYFLPPKGKDLTQCSLEVSVLSEPLVAIEGATKVVFDGVDIECSRGMGVYIERGADNRIQNATLRNLGIVAVCIGKGTTPDPNYRQGCTAEPVSRALGSWHEHIYDNTTFNREGGTNHRISNCEIYNIGEGGISLGGGDRKTLTPAGNVVENCHIHHFNRWDRTYRGAVNIDGVGNKIVHCLIHDAPSVAIYLHGNDHLIEYNEIHHVMMEGDDMAAFYMGRDPSERGNVLRFNYWHDLGIAHKTYALYFDDYGGDGSHVYGNVFFRAGYMATLNINHSSDMLVENNLFIDCNKAFRMGGTIPYRIGEIRSRLAAAGYDQSPWTDRYPGFENYLEGEHPRDVVLKNNLIMTADDPRLVDGANENFTLKTGIDGLEIFWPVPFEQMGLRD
jgi:hypothetical protein